LDNIFYERAFERLIPQGHSFYALDTTEYFSVELDTVNDFIHIPQSFHLQRKRFQIPKDRNFQNRK
jgi:hypothetical protein